MARTDVTLTTLGLNAATANPAGDDLDPTNGMVITPGVRFDKLIVEVEHTTDAEKDVTFKAGDQPMANAAGQGDLVTAFAAGDSTPVIKRFVLSSARFSQSDQTINVDIETGATGKIRAYLIP